MAKRAPAVVRLVPHFRAAIAQLRDIPFPDAGHLGLPTCVFRHALLREQRRQVQALRAIHPLVRHLLPSTSTTWQFVNIASFKENT